MSHTKPPQLYPGDLIYITAPAKAIERSYIDETIRWIEDNGWRAQVSEHCLGKHHYFSGTDDERRVDLQHAIDNPEIKAIWCARGGYGSLRIIDQLSWAGMLFQPKWFIGFSDITAFHLKLYKLEIQSIHGTMPYNINTCSESSLDSLKNILRGNKINYSGISAIGSKKGTAIGPCIGGNMSLVYSLLGTDDQPDFRDTILFLEDIGESMYSIDRMCQAFRKARIWEDISGLIIGNISKLRQMESDYGVSIEALFLEQLQFRKIPVLFYFPVGHEPNNLGMICGEEMKLSIFDSGKYLVEFERNQE